VARLAQNSNDPSVLSATDVDNNTHTSPTMSSWFRSGKNPSDESPDLQSLPEVLARAYRRMCSRVEKGKAECIKLTADQAVIDAFAMADRIGVERACVSLDLLRCLTKVAKGYFGDKGIRFYASVAQDDKVTIKYRWTYHGKESSSSPIFSSSTSLPESHFIEVLCDEMIKPEYLLKLALTCASRFELDGLTVTVATDAPTTLVFDFQAAVTNAKSGAPSQGK
jgi:hypothetical protein